MRNLALADVTEGDLRVMLAENETLFVEHKAGIDGDAFQVSKAITSFANMLGGWILIGVTEGAPNEGKEGGWNPLRPHEMTDRVREALASNGVDPIPAFAATVRPYGDPPQEVGVVRVYESADTPHVMGNGQVFVRSVAQDRVAHRIYKAQGIETQVALLALADRGRSGADRAKAKLNPERAPLAAAHVGLSSAFMATSERGLIGVRAVPVTGDRLADWGVSAGAAGALGTAARKLARREDTLPLDDPVPHASGLTVSARSEDLLGVTTEKRDGIARVGTDTAGLVVGAFQFSVWEPKRPTTHLTLDGMRDLVLRPLLESILGVLNTGELYGRVLLELRVGALDEVIQLDDAGGQKAVPRRLPVGGELALPLSSGSAELDGLLDQWRSDVGRAAGYLTLRI
jgi:hypothetical protein